MADVATVQVSVAAGTEDVLTPEALALLARLQRSHGAAQRALLAYRQEVAAAFQDGSRKPGLLPETAWLREAAWQVRPAPADLTDRRCEITGPTDRKMMISALNSGARVFMTDFEDSLSPSWDNIVQGQRNLRDAAAGTISFGRPDGSVDRVNANPATLVVRARGLHLPEPRVSVDGELMSASLFDVAVAALHSAPLFTAKGSGLYLYLPKLEHYHEALWWDAALSDIEAQTGLADGAIRVTVLIETILASFQMEEILWALRKRIVGLNAGRWDYIFSVIKKLGHDKAFVLPDRGQVTMTVPFMAAYAQRLVATCHKRGAHAIGGMSAFIPNRRNPEVTERALAAVTADKQREANMGYDGTWVAHPDLVEVATAQFDAVLGTRSNQLEICPSPTTEPAALVDVAIPGSTVTLTGVRNNISVGLQYMEAWLNGRGAVAIYDLMEDAATAEISRSQLWQWVRHGVTLDDGTVVTAELVDRELRSEVVRLADEGFDAARLEASAELLRQVSLADKLPDFLTLAALAQLG